MLILYKRLIKDLISIILLQFSFIYYMYIREGAKKNNFRGHEADPPPPVNGNVF